MNRLDLARSLAKKSHRSRAKAADTVDSLVYRLLKELKEPAELERKPRQASEKAASPRAKT